MLLSDTVQVKLSNNVRYWSNLGFTGSQGTVITVPVSLLPKNSNKKVTWACDLCSKITESSFQSVMRQNKTHKCYDCSRKYVGDNMNTENIKKSNALRCAEKHPRWNHNKNEYQKYSNRVRFLSERTYLKHIEIVNPDKHKRTLCGVKSGYQLDHKKSIKQCFLDGVSIEFCSDVSNLQMIPWELNRKKSYH